MTGPNTAMTDGPFDFEFSVHVTDGKGASGTASYSFPPGIIPDIETVKRAMEDVSAMLPAGLRLMTRHEYVNGKLCESAGVDMKFGGLGSPDFRHEWDAQ